MAAIDKLLALWTNPSQQTPALALSEWLEIDHAAQEWLNRLETNPHNPLIRAALIALRRELTQPMFEIAEKEQITDESR